MRSSGRRKRRGWGLRGVPCTLAPLEGGWGRSQSRANRTVPRGRRNAHLLALAEPSTKSGRSQALLIRCWDVVQMRGLPTWVSLTTYCSLYVSSTSPHPPPQPQGSQGTDPAAALIPLQGSFQDLQNIGGLANSWDFGELLTCSRCWQHVWRASVWFLNGPQVASG